MAPPTALQRALYRALASATPLSRQAGALARCLGSGAGPAPAPAEEEVERKFRATPAVIEGLARHAAAPPRVVPMTDIYFDDAAYSLSTRDMWLRRRNKGFELKWPQEAAASSAGGIDFYHESTSWAQIAEQLERLARLQLRRPVPAEGDAGEGAQAWLGSHGMRPFAAIHTTRRRYALALPVRGGAGAGAGSERHTVNVDLDEVRYDAAVGVDSASAAAAAALAADPAQLCYSLGEVELVAAGGGMRAQEAMADVFRTLGIGPEPVRGKVLEWLVRARPAHYAALERCGLIAAKMQ